MSLEMYRWSNFVIKVPIGNKVILKNMLTGATVLIKKEIGKTLEENKGNGKVKGLDKLYKKENSFLVPIEMDEFQAWRSNFLKRREEADTFILFFLPTTNCQFRCSYCFEKGNSNRMNMSDETFDQSVLWVSDYLDKNKNLKAFRLSVFGGEPLLNKKQVQKGLEVFHSIATKRGLDFWSELTTNGELLDGHITKELEKNKCQSVQITLDGNERTHNTRRFGVGGRPTFKNIINGIKLLIEKSEIPSIDIRISLDGETVNEIPKLLNDLARLNAFERINLSLGIVMPSLDTGGFKETDEIVLADSILNIWKFAKKLGFKIPEDFVVGPWCVAIAKHSAVLQPSGKLQKCFCTVGRDNFDFSSIQRKVECYLSDPMFEKFERFDDCISQKCKFLPVCGGGCIYDSIVKNGYPKGFEKVFCRKTLISKVNQGLLKILYT